MDGELAAVLRHADDRLSDGDRFRLTQVLGRAIGVVGPGPAGAPVRRRRSGAPAGWADGLACAVHDAAVGELRALASRRSTAALGVHPSPVESRAHAGGRDVDRLSWSLMLEPTPVSTSAAWVDRLVLLHQCYEQAMVQLGPAGTPVTRAVAARSGP